MSGEKNKKVRHFRKIAFAKNEKLNYMIASFATT